MNDQDAVMLQIAYKVYTEYPEPEKAAQYLFGVFNDDPDKMFAMSGKLGESLAVFNMGYSLTVAAILNNLFEEREMAELDDKEEMGEY